MRAVAFADAIAGAHAHAERTREITGKLRAIREVPAMVPADSRGLILEDDPRLASELACEVEMRGAVAVVCSTPAQALAEIGRHPLSFAIVEQVGCATDTVLLALERFEVPTVLYTTDLARANGHALSVIVKPGLADLRTWLDKQVGR